MSNQRLCRRVRPAAVLLMLMAIVLSGFLVPVTLHAAPLAGVLYVNTNAAAGGNGATWGTAYKYLRDALNAATPGDEIWVAAGVYYPDEGAGVTADDRAATFNLKAGVGLYGGFAGTETSRDQRDWNANLTVLSGDIDRNDSGKVNGVLQSHTGIVGSNSYHVVTARDFNAGPVVVDGFAVTGGDSSDLEPGLKASGGGGIRLIRAYNITLENLTVRGNRTTTEISTGGGIFAYHSNVNIRRTVIRNNLAGGAGGGLGIDDTFAMHLEEIHVLENEFTPPGKSACFRYVAGGGGIFSNAAINLLVTDSIIENNVGYCYGGGIVLFLGNGFKMQGGAIRNNEVRYSGKTSSSSSNGGGYYSLDARNQRLANVLIAGNLSETDSGGLEATWANRNGSLDLINTTIVANEAKTYAALQVKGDQTLGGTPLIRVKNGVIWNNSITGAGPILYADATLQIGNSLVQGSNGSGGSWNAAYGTDLGGNIDSSPGFIQPPVGAAPAVTGNFRLGLGSPAIDTGLNTAVTLPTDADGYPRIFNNVVDMGAYETQVVCPVAGTTRLYVNAIASGSGLGTSWTDAIPSLQNALALAQRCPSNSINEIWVAWGAYYPDDGNYQIEGDRAAAFELKNGLAIYGGFLGYETALSQRLPWSFLTVLSGDIDHNDTTDAFGLVETPAGIVGANSFHVVEASSTAGSAVLDGFAITGGKANGSPTARQHEGGALFADGGSPTLNNLILVGNLAEEGGAMTLVGGSNAAISNAWFGGNAASDYGGALHNESSNPTMVNVLISGNRAAAGGGAIYNLASSPKLTNVTIAGNAAGGTVSTAAVAIAPAGGGILNLTGSKPDIRNSIIWANQDSSGVGTASASMRNLDIGSTPSADNSDIQGLAAITGLIFDGTSIDADPLFVTSVNPASAPAFTPSLELKAGSPAIDAGNDSFNSQPLDLDLRPRIQGAAIDMGPFEATPAPHVALHKSASTSLARAGETITYTYQVVNTGLVTLTAISASDDRLGTINFGVSEVAPSASASAVLTYTVVEGDLPGPLKNTATVTATSALSGTVVATDTAAVSISYRPRLVASITPNVSSALPGTTVTYTVQVKNMGDVSLSGVTATDSRLGAVTLDTTALAPGATATGLIAYTVQSSDLPGPLVDTVTGAGTTPLSSQVKGTASATVVVIDPNPPSAFDLFLPTVAKQ